PNFLSQVDECFIPTAAVYGYTLRISSGFRTVAEQDQLYKQGRTVDGHIVTEAPGGKSIHNFGFAVDVVDRWREYDIDWEKLAKIGTYCGLEPSEEGDISHFENRDGLTTADFVAGRRPAALALPCAVMAERAKANQSLTLKDLQNCGASKF
ncbi:M15 family metallopeptidase, partial [Patescibacteria group bacterium]|nr:M15 family metallopeptidase [Patescibacteria group bacterium]